MASHFFTSHGRSKPQDISVQGYNTGSWYHASIPSTVLNVLVQNGIYPHILDSLTLKDISQEPFDIPWWYRTSFNLASIANNAQLDLLESLKRLLAYPQDYWPNNNPVWVYHLGAHPKLQTLDRHDEAMAARYGAPSNLEEYA